MAVFGIDRPALLRCAQHPAAGAEVVLKAGIPVVIPEIVEEFLLQTLLAIVRERKMRVCSVGAQVVIPVGHAEH